MFLKKFYSLTFYIKKELTNKIKNSQKTKPLLTLQSRIYLRGD